jgi:hypothetical protein
MMGSPFANSVALLVIGAALSFAAAWFWFRKNAAVAEARRISEEHAKLVTRVADMERQMGQVGQAILPISAAFQAILIKELTHFHTPVMDALLVKLGPPVTLTADEEVALQQALETRVEEMNGALNEAERDAAIMLPMVMRRVRAENEALANAPSELRVVAVVPDKAVEEETPES